MARKVTDTTMIADDSYLLSQTPANYNAQNFYLKELQDKVNAEWRFRPNRVDIEYEVNWGKDDYAPIEVVVQHVKGDQGTAYSDDFRRLVFKNIREERFNIGNKFLFNPSYKQNVTNEEKDTWLVTNFSSISPTTSVVVQRCVGTLNAPVYKKGPDGKDTKEVDYYHHEPVILGTSLTSVGLLYNETAISPQSQLIALAQHNQYTKQYYINQRFVVGYDKVYRITALNKSYSKETQDPYQIGLMKIYLELTEESPYDIFDSGEDNKFTAYQGDNDVKLKQTGSENDYEIRFVAPMTIPNAITGSGVHFIAKVYQGSTVIDAPVEFTFTLEGLPNTVSIDRYLNIQVIDGNNVEVSLKRVYLNGTLTITVSAEVNNERVSAHVNNIAVDVL